MKFTNKDLMKSTGLTIGDKVKFVFEEKIFIGKVGFYDDYLSIIMEDEYNEIKALFHLIFIINNESEFEILPKPKRVGDLKCKEDCDNCPLKVVCAIGIYNDDWSYYDILEDSKIKSRDQEIYDLLKARLDKEVKENEKID